MAGKESNKLTKSAQKSAEIMALEEEYANYMIATHGGDKENADKKYAEALSMINKKYK